jgi:hypothetical protein
MSILINHYEKRTCAYDITINDGNGNAITLAVGDKIRLKIWSEDETTPKLDLVSGTPAAGGSNVSAANPTRFTLNQADAIWTPRIYSIEVSIVDAGDTYIRHADSGVFCLHKAPGGDTN